MLAANAKTWVGKETRLAAWHESKYETAQLSGNHATMTQSGQKKRPNNSQKYNLRPTIGWSAKTSLRRLTPGAQTQASNGRACRNTGLKLHILGQQVLTQVPQNAVVSLKKKNTPALKRLSSKTSSTEFLDKVWFKTDRNCSASTACKAWKACTVHCTFWGQTRSHWLALSWDEGSQGTLRKIPSWFKGFR